MIIEKEEILCPREEIRQVYQFEEDVLVPDIKEDMKEILFLEGTAGINPGEREIAPGRDDFLNLTGDLEVQLIYKCTREEEIEAIKTRIPFKYQWNLKPKEEWVCKLSCTVKNLDYAIVNERKFRIKASLEFSGKCFSKKEYTFFQGIEGENLEKKEEDIFFTSLAMRKKDFLEIDEHFVATDRDVSPEVILSQSFVITENYKQIMADKIVINGFIYCNLLYTGVSNKGDGEEKVFRSHTGRVEFTQFIPIDRELAGKKWCGAHVDFKRSKLEVRISVSEEREYNFQIKGQVETEICLYESISRRVVVDAYHLEKNFIATKEKQEIFNIVALTSSEASIREIINLPSDVKVREAIFCKGEPVVLKTSCEKGRGLVLGKVLCQILYGDKEGEILSMKERLEFRAALESPEIESFHNLECSAYLKNVWCEVINEGQLEINGQILLEGQINMLSSINTPKDVSFSSEPLEKLYPITIAMAEEGETLWDLAKRYKTKKENICSVNQIEEDEVLKDKILIVR